MSRRSWMGNLLQLPSTSKKSPKSSTPKRSPETESIDLNICPTFELPLMERPIPTAPEALEEKFPLTDLNIELEISISVLVNKDPRTIGHLIAPLINLKMDYRGESRLRNIWTALTVIVSNNLEKTSSNKAGIRFMATMSKGLHLCIESPKRFEIGRKETWSQTFDYLSDGLRTTWEIRGEIGFTYVKYRPLKGGAEVLKFLNGMACPARSTENGDLILIA